MQNRAAGMITSMSYEDADDPSILYRLGWLSIRHLIVFDLAVATFKVAKGIAPPPTQEIFHYISELHSYDTIIASSGNSQLKSVRLTVGKSAISYIGPKIWNDIENQIKQLKTIETFKGKIFKNAPWQTGQPVNYHIETHKFGIINRDFNIKIIQLPS